MRVVGALLALVAIAPMVHSVPLRGDASDCDHQILAQVN